MTQRSGTAQPRRLPSSFDDLQGAEVISPDDRSMTKFMPYVTISPETREQAVTLAEAAWQWVEEMTENGVADDTELVKAVTRFFA